MDPLQQQMMLRAAQQQPPQIAPGQDDPNTPWNIAAHPKADPGMIQQLLAKLQALTGSGRGTGIIGPPAPMGGLPGSGPTSGNQFLSAVSQMPGMQTLKRIVGM